MGLDLALLFQHQTCVIRRVPVFGCRPKQWDQLWRHTLASRPAKLRNCVFDDVSLFDTDCHFLPFRSMRL